MQDALAENRLDAIASPTRELAARAGADIDVFNRVVEALAYHGQLSLLVEAFRIALPGVNASNNIVPWGISEFLNRAADYEIFNYLEHASSPEPTDPVLLDRVKFFFEDPREDYLSEFLGDLRGKSGREWRVDDFDLRSSRKRDRDEWDDDAEAPLAQDTETPNLLRLINEFFGYLRREEGVPFPRGQLVRNHLYRYFLDRHQGELDPRPSMLEQAMNPRHKLPKPPRPAHPLCPERVTLDVYLGGLMGFLSNLVYPAAAVFQAMPAWLRFLESRRLIDANMRQKVANELLPLHATLTKYWRSCQDDPSLAREGEAWPADAAKGPAI